MNEYEDLYSAYRRKSSEALAAEQMSFKFFRKCVRGQRGSP